ncbi:MAG TPA: class I SAM-dependent methyltransferase [Gemmatimonadales bacterium]|nr:class I SAM-dependent methyltransferase [Gemmatimonadales bacterium]
MKSTDRNWQRLGQRNPYYGVVSDERNRADRLDAAAYARFFESGERHVAGTLDALQQHFGSVDRQSSCLDFGCGVGRLVLPLARRFRRVVGVDVSPGMLREAQRNCRAAGIDNAHLIRTDEARGLAAERFGLVHSYIVFQHIPERRGRRIFSRLLALLRPGGLGTIHFSYAREAGRLRRLARPLRRFRPVNAAANLMLGKAWNEPFMAMHNYDVNELMLMLQHWGVDQVYCRLTAGRDGGGYRGISLMFRKPLETTA